MFAINKLRQLGRDTRGMSTVEYAVLLVLIVAGAVGLWRSIGQNVINGLGAADKNIEKEVGVLTPKGK